MIKLNGKWAREPLILLRKGLTRAGNNNKKMSWLTNMHPLCLAKVKLCCV